MAWFFSGHIAGVPAAPKGEKSIVSPLETPHRPAKYKTLIIN